MDYMYQTVDKDFVETIVGKLKSQGIFDQFRKDCLADVDTKPAYQNLQERVNGTVNTFLEKHKWQENLNKTQLRESLRRHVQQGFLETGVDRIVDQVVNPKIYTVFKPKVEDVVYDSLGIPKPNQPDKDRNLLNFILKHPPPPHPPPPIPPPPPVKDPIKSNVVQLEDLLPKDLDPISPGSVDDLTFSPKEDEQNNVITSTNNSNDIANNNNNNNSNNNNTNYNNSSAFELISTEISNDESKLSLSDLTSRDSTKNSIQTGPKSDAQFDIESNTNSVEQNATNSLSPFKNFSNLNEKIKQAEIKLGEMESEKNSVEIPNDFQNNTEIILEKDFCEKQEKEECSSFKIFSEDSTSSLSSISREKKLASSNNNRDISNNDEILNDSSQRSDKMDDCDSSVSNIEKLEIKTDSTEKTEVKSEKRRSESWSSKHTSSRHIHDSKRDRKHHNHDDYKKDYKSNSSKSDKDRKHHDDRHKNSKDRRECGHKENRSKEDTDNEKPKHGGKSSRHRENDDKLEKIKHRDSSEKHREEKLGKSEKSTERTKHRHNEDKRAHQDKSKYREAEEKQRDSDTLSMDIEDNVEYDLTDRTQEYEIIRDNETEEKTDVNSEKESDHKDYEEKSDKHIVIDYEKEEKMERHEKLRHKEEKQDKLKLKESDDKHKENRVRSKEGESKQRSEKSAEKLEKSGKYRDSNDRNKEERSSKSEKIKHKEESGEQQKDDKGRSKDVKNRHSMDTESATIKEDRNKSDEKDPDKERSRRHSDKSKSRHSSNSSGKHRSDKDEKKDKDARKRKGERCEEIKVKESRRSSDRDHNGPGSGFSTSSGKSKDNTNNSYSKTNETIQDQGREGSSSIEENTDSLDCPEVNDVDILLMKINDSIENDLVKNNRNEDEKFGDNVPLPLKKPKIANNIFEIKKIMQARRNIEKMEALENLENNTVNEKIHEDDVNEINEADSSICQEEEIKDDEIVLGAQQTEDATSTEFSIDNLTAESSEVIEKTEEVESGKHEEFVEDISENALVENERQPEEVVVNVAEPSFIKKHRIANNIYEVRKIMQMKKRLEKKQKQAALLEEEHRTVDEQTVNNNKDNHQVEEQLLPTEEQLVLESENCILDEGDEDNLDISASNLAKESDITKAIEENQSNDTTIVEEENTTEECPGDNVENVEPTTLKTPRIARNIYEVRKIIRARKALKRKLKLQTKNYELNITRKHMIKSLLNSKKLLNVKRKGEQIVKLKLITKEKKNRLKRDNNSRKILNRKENSKVNEMDGKEVVDCSVPCDGIEISVVEQQQNESESMQETHSWPEASDGFLGFTKKEIEIACNQLEELKCVLMSNLSKNFIIDTLGWKNQLDGNSNMVKSSTLYNNRKRQTVISVKSRKNNMKLTTKEEMKDDHDKVVRDIMNGKNGCTIKLTKSSCLDEQAKYVSTNKRIRLTHNNVENQDVEDINSNLDDCNNINESKKYEWNDRILSTSLTEDVLDNLMKENYLMPEDSVEYAESLSNSEENFKIMARNKNTKPKEQEVNNGKTKIMKNDGHSKVKVRNCTDEVNLIGKQCSGNNSHGPASKVRNNIVNTQDEKQKRSTRTSFRSTQRYDSEDLYKPRLALSQNSSRTRFNRSESADGATTTTTSTNACPTLPNLRRKVR